MISVYNKQGLQDLGLNPFAFELVEESFRRTIEKVGIPKDKAHVEYIANGVTVSVKFTDPPAETTRHGSETDPATGNEPF